MFVTEIIHTLRHRSSPLYLDGMKRFGINSSKALRVPIPEIRKLAKSIKKDHALALELWDTGIHEARILASLVDDPKLAAIATAGNILLQNSKAAKWIAANALKELSAK